MASLPEPITDALTPELRARVAASIASIGVLATARLLGVDGSTVTRLAVPGATVRHGSIALTVLNAHRLGT